MSTPKTLNVTECHQLLDALLVKEGTKNQFRKGLRNYTMALLMLDAGLRVGEVVNLYQSDMVLAGEPVISIRIRAEIAKNKTERIVPLSQRLRNTIKTMREKWWTDKLSFDVGYAFCSGKTMTPMTTRQVERIIRAAAMASIGRPVHPHVLRHTFGTRLMRTCNERIVQELLGHRNITSTQIYTHPNEQDKRKAIDDIEDKETRSDPRG